MHIITFQGTHHLSGDDVEYDRSYNSEPSLTTDSALEPEEMPPPAAAAVDTNSSVTPTQTPNVTDDMMSSVNKSAHLVLKSGNDTIGKIMRLQMSVENRYLCSNMGLNFKERFLYVNPTWADRKYDK